MKPEIPFSEFIDNTYFNSYFLEFEMRPYFEKRHQSACQQAFENIKKIYQNIDIQILSEAQLKEEFIKPILRELGYAFTYEVPRLIFGKECKLDFALYQNDEIQRKAYQNHRASNKNMLAICESKAYGKILDTKKVTAKLNPHFQLLRYQNDLWVNFGFLTNGKYWRFYDITEQRQDKIYYEVDLEWILKNDNAVAFEYFYFIFYKNNLLKMNQIDDSEATAEDITELNRKAILRVENDLKEVIYGTESIVEKIGQCLFDRHKNEYSLRQIYANSVVFAYRILFISYCESKFQKVLFDEEYTYKMHALNKILRDLENHSFTAKGKPKYVGWNHLKLLFQYLNKGNLDLRIPLLDGGLFAEDKAPLLKKPCILNDEELHQILTQLLYHKNKVFRDYKTLSVTHLGNIYEGLLETELRQPIAKTYYLIFQEGKTEKEGYFDIPDYHRLKKNKRIKILKESTYERGNIFLSNQSNTRKSTASYYTPKSITDFMTEESISKILETKESILDLRIMDNACGSGHFLVEVLKNLTQKALDRLEDDKDSKLKQFFENEKITIEKNIKDIFSTKDYNLDELTVLKRILLKKIIFGVDLNDFAVELTRLSLWLDTFVLGTPLSFIEHHIQQGNALIGARKRDLLQKLGDENPLMAGELKQKIEKLIQKLEKLSNLKDNTAEEIQQSKKIYHELQPDLQRLNLVMNFHTFEKFVLLIYKDKKERNQILGELGTLLSKFEEDIFEGKNTELINKIQKTAQLFSFFHYEITFAEVFQNGHSGFDLIIGNPPWDKTKFDDKDFFSGWRSSYRTMKQSEKKEERKNILEYTGVQEEYDSKKDFIIYANEYYKKHYPLNAGVGDNNLFRFFIEKNLRMLTKDGIMTYVTPSAWIYEASSTNIRKYILENYNLYFFYQFENRKGIFPRVHRSYKFAMFMLTPIQQNEPRLLTIPVRFMQTDTEILYKTDCYDGKYGILQYPFSAIAELSPDYHALFEIKAQKDLEIIRSAYQKFEKINPEFIDFRRELDMSVDRDIFQEQKGEMILYEGKMIHQFQNNFGTPQYWVKKSDLEAKLRKIEVSRLISDIYDQIKMKKSTKKKTVLDFLKLKDESELEKLTVLNTEFYRLVFRGIARNTDARTLIAGIIPNEHTFGHSMFGHIPKKYISENGTVKIKVIPLERVLFVQAIFNSLILDFIIRFLVDINVVKSILMRLPLPQPSDEELVSNEVYIKLIINSLKLNLFYNSNLSELSKMLKIDKVAPPKNDKSRLKIQVENDILIAKLYGVDKEGIDHLTSTDYFKVWNERQPEYRELLLELFDEITL